MTTVPGSPVWELVKKNNYFLIKQFGNNNTKVQSSNNNLVLIIFLVMLSCSASEVVLFYPSLDLLYTVVLSCNLILTQNITLSNPCLIYNIVILCSLIICKMAGKCCCKDISGICACI